MAEYEITLPVSEEKIRELRVGDILYITGTVVTARDEAHKKVLEAIEGGETLPVGLEGLALYHCGPVVQKREGEWVVIAAGPTTSARMEGVEAEFIEKTHVRIVIGKGGMGQRTAEAAKEYGAVYTVFTGGAAVLAADAIKRVTGVYWLEELGIPEAMWVFDVENFGPLVVTIDPTGKNFYAEADERRKKVVDEIYRELGFG